MSCGAGPKRRIEGACRLLWRVQRRFTGGSLGCRAPGRPPLGLRPASEQMPQVRPFSKKSVRLADVAAAALLPARPRPARAQAALAPVYSGADLVADPHVRATEMLTEVPDEDLGDLLLHNVMWKLSETPGRIRFTGRAIGADTDAILGGNARRLFGLPG